MAIYSPPNNILTIFNPLDFVVVANSTNANSYNVALAKLQTINTTLTQYQTQLSSIGTSPVSSFNPTTTTTYSPNGATATLITWTPSSAFAVWGTASFVNSFSNTTNPGTPYYLWFKGLVSIPDYFITEHIPFGIKQTWNYSYADLPKNIAYSSQIQVLPGNTGSTQYIQTASAPANIYFLVIK